MLKNKLSFILLGVILLTHAFILTRLIFFPYPELFIYPYLTNNGLKPYQQIFDQHFPGLLFLPVNFGTLGMTTPEAARIAAIAVAVIVQLMLFFIAKKLFKSSKKALLVNLLYLIWQPFFEGWVLWIDNFLPLMLLPAFYFLHQRKVFLTGIFLGAGIVFKQAIIPLAALAAIFILWESRSFKTAARFASGLIILPLLMVIYFLGIGVFGRFWFWAVTFNLTTFAAYGRKAPFFSGIVRLAAVYAPVVLLPFLKMGKTAIILLIFIIGGLSGDFVRFDFVHFQPSLPFVLLATAAVFFKLWNMKIIRFAAIGYALVAAWWLTVFFRGHWSDRVMFFDKETYEIAGKIKEYTEDKEEIFILGPVPHLYQLSNTLPTGQIFVFQFPWFLMESEESFLRALENNPPELIVRDKTVVIEGNPITRFAPRLMEYSQNNYEVFDKIGSTEFLRAVSPQAPLKEKNINENRI